MGGRPRNEHAAKEVEARRPTFADSAPAPVAPETGVKDIEAAAPPSLAKHDRHEDEHKQDVRKATGEPAKLSAEASDDRYAVPASSRADISSAKPMVIQVSGDVAGEAARQPDGHAREERGAALENRASFGTARGEAQPHPDYTIGGRGEVDSFENRRPGAAALRGNETSPSQLPPAQPNYGQPSYPAANITGRDPRFGNESAAAAQVADNSAAGYPGPGYARADSARREEFQQPAVPPNPLRADGMYEVLPNDSYWTISQRVYGSGAYFKALAEANRGKTARPDRLAPGLLISTPPVAQLEKDYTDFCPRANHREAVRNRAAGTASLAAYSGGRTYVVQEGDTLSSIARNELGKVSRWADIYQLNREALGKDYDYLTPGMKLALPPTEGPTADRTARRTDTAPAAARY